VITGKNLPKEMIEKWPEIFEGITPNVIPLKYVYAIKIEFKNHKTWEVEINKSKRNTWNDIELQIKEIVIKYSQEIENLDFKIDTVQLKKDIIKSTDKFLKKKKL
jgi:hypothetical protein